MKPAFSLSLVLAGLAAAAEPESVVRFANKDSLAGSLESLSADRIVWNSPLLERPVPLFLRNVVDVTLPDATPDQVVDHQATLTLTNGDTVRGQLASVTEENVCLDTWFAGRMNFNRLMVSGIKIEGKSPLLYRGPTGLEDWKQSGDGAAAWTYARSAFRSNGRGSIAKEDILPEECSVSFDAAWKSDAFALKVILYSNDAATESPNSGYELSFQSSSVYLQNCKTKAFLGSSHSQALAENEKVHVEIRSSSKSGKVGLFINNRIVEVWNDPDVQKGRFGKNLHFISQNTLPMKISGIEIAQWDGTVDRLPEPKIGLMRQFGLRGMNQEVKPAPKEEPKEGKMELANGDNLDGEVSSIQDGNITVKTSLGEVKVPVARFRSIALKKVDLERCIRRKGDIRAWFPDGSSLVFRLDGVGDGTLTGSSQNFGGPSTFKIAAFNRIEFNIYDPEMEDKRPTDEW